jgi:hypothetical protein
VPCKLQHGTILRFNGTRELVGARQSAPAAILGGQKSENSDRIKSRPLGKLYLSIYLSKGCSPSAASFLSCPVRLDFAAILHSNKITCIRVCARTGVRHAANTIEEMQKLLLGYRDNMRVEVEQGISVTAKTVADLRALSTWPEGLVLNIHVDLDPRLSVVTVQWAS